jgi:hypothetical protein
VIDTCLGKVVALERWPQAEAPRLILFPDRLPAANEPRQIQ